LRLAASKRSASRVMRVKSPAIAAPSSRPGRLRRALLTASFVANRIDGKVISAKVRQEVTQAVAEYKQSAGRVPGLHVVLASHDPASAVYVRNKEKMAAEVGIDGRVHRLEESVTQAEIEGLVRELNHD